jgi:hypothetical protein
MPNILLWLSGVCLGLCFLFAAIAYYNHIHHGPHDEAGLKYGPAWRPEFTNLSIIIDEFSDGHLYGNAELSIGNNRLYQPAVESEGLALILRDITDTAITPHFSQLLPRTKSPDIALFGNGEKFEIPRSGNIFSFPFDSYLVAVMPVFQMNRTPEMMANRTTMGIALKNKTFKVEALKKHHIDRDWFQSIFFPDKVIECRKGCGIDDGIFIFKVSRAGWYKWAVFGILLTLLFLMLIILKGSNIPAGLEFLGLCAAIYGLRTFFFNPQFTQLYAVDFYFGAYLLVWLMVQAFNSK